MTPVEIRGIIESHTGLDLSNKKNHIQLNSMKYLYYRESIKETDYDRERIASIIDIKQHRGLMYRSEKELKKNARKSAIVRGWIKEIEDKIYQRKHNLKPLTKGFSYLQL